MFTFPFRAISGEVASFEIPDDLKVKDVFNKYNEMYNAKMNWITAGSALEVGEESFGELDKIYNNGAGTQTTVIRVSGAGFTIAKLRAAINEVIKDTKLHSAAGEVATASGIATAYKDKMHTFKATELPLAEVIAPYKARLDECISEVDLQDTFLEIIEEPAFKSLKSSRPEIGAELDNVYVEATERVTSAAGKTHGY